uniref:Ras-GEF domain-containing protein n=1 Tax=Arcella intermedia TaxID=1963864 RepID=A0A6B2L162_9EUKA
MTLDCEKSLSTELDNEFTSGRWVRFVQQNILIAIYQNITSFFFLICQLLPELKPSEEQSMTCTLHVLTLINSIHKIFRSLLVNVDNINNLEKIVERKGKESAPEDIQKILKGSKNSSMDNTDKETESEQLLEKPDSPGDLDNLILRLTPSLSHTPNHDFTNAFLTTCHRFSSPYDVLERLFDRFNVLTKRQEKMKGKTKDPKRQHEDDVGMAGVRVVNTIVKWLKANTHFVDENIANLLRLFVDKNLRKVQLFESPIRLMDNELMNTHQYDFPSTLSRKPPDAIVAFIGDYDPYEIILQVDELVIAQQLTLIEWEIYVKIREVELLNQSWSKEKRQPIAQNVVQLMQRANRTSFWVATSILLQSRAKDRTKAVTKFMNIAKHLKDLNNYNTLMAIIAGLNTVSVSRLKQTFASVKKNVLEQWEILMEVMNPSNSFKKLRTALEEAGQTALPYIGLYLSDLTFMEDGNPDYITSEDGTKLINYAKHFMIYKAIDSFKKFQTISKYGSQFQKTDHFKFLFHLPVFDETDLYQLSLLREPRENQ